MARSGKLLTQEYGKRRTNDHHDHGDLTPPGHEKTDDKNNDKIWAPTKIRQSHAGEVDSSQQINAQKSIAK